MKKRKEYKNMILDWDDKKLVEFTIEQKPILDGDVNSYMCLCKSSAKKIYEFLKDVFEPADDGRGEK